MVQVVENHGDSIDFDLAREFFRKKCSHKQVTAPTAKNLTDLVLGSEELKADWAGMLAHQLQALPPIDPIFGRLDSVLGWLDAPLALPQQPAGSSAPTPRPGLQLKALGNPAHWAIVAPPSVTFWGSAPVEQIRFAGANRLMIAFTYHGKARVAEPYSLRRAAAGHLTLFAWGRGDPNIKQFRIDEIQNLSVTKETFVPKYEIELTGSMIPSARAGTRTLRTRLPRFTSGRTYVFRCPFCSRQFKHERNNAALRPHQTTDGSNCMGRRGYLERIE